MNEKFRLLREKVTQTQQDATRASRHLENALRDCRHEWNPAKYDPVVTSGGSYEASGAGSDWRPGGSYAGTTKPRWSRSCIKCGKVEYTEKADPVVSAMTPIFT